MACSYVSFCPALFSCTLSPLHKHSGPMHINIMMGSIRGNVAVPTACLPSRVCLSCIVSAAQVLCAHVR
jgi:hypothetical protein